MKRNFLFVKSAAVLVLILVLGACSQIGKQSTDEAQLKGEMLAFSEAGNLHDVIEFEQAVRDGKIGESPSTAFVPLFFGENGNLLKVDQLGAFLEAREAGALQEVDDSSAFEALLSDLDMSLYFTDFATYETVMRQLAANGKLSLEDYAPLEAANTTINTFPTMKTQAFDAKVHTFNPYAFDSIVQEAQNSIIALQQTDECVALVERNLGAPPSEFGTAQLIEFADKQASDLLETQQGPCVTGCLAAQTACSISCLYIPAPPAAAACAAACAASSVICVAGCD